MRIATAQRCYVIELDCRPSGGSTGSPFPYPIDSQVLPESGGMILATIPEGRVHSSVQIRCENTLELTET